MNSKVLALTVPGLEASEKFKILCAFERLKQEPNAPSPP
jgi:hypothetical protein